MPIEPCPACGVRPSSHLAVPWGDGQHRLAVLPWLCMSCGALAILEGATGRLTATTEADWEPVRQRNPVLWETITRARALVYASRREPPHDAPPP